MTRIKESDFVARHAFTKLSTTELKSDPKLAPVATADVDNNGEIAGAPELSSLYRKLAALDTSATPATGVDLDAPSVKPVYSALAVRFTQQIGVEGALGKKTLDAVPELAGVVAGAVTMKRNGLRQLGMGSVQDALNLIAVANEKNTGTPSTFKVNLGANDGNRGIFGPGSETAIKNFQRAEGLPQSGTIDASTLRAIDTALAVVRGQGTTGPTDPTTPTTPTTPTNPTNPTAGTGGAARFSAHTALSDVAAGKVTLRAGERGPHVEALQTALLDMGFAMMSLKNDVGVSGVDGAWGAQTTTAITNFQVHAKKKFPDVKVNGVVDKATMTALLALAPEPGKKAWDAGQPNQAPASTWNADPSKQLRVVVAKDEHRTFLYDTAGTCIGIFPNAPGNGNAGNGTESGLKKIRTRLDESSAKQTGINLWGDDRSFGKRIVDLSWFDGRSSGEELHGTYDYKNMGKDVSHGCVRHYNEDIIVIFNQLKVGELVAICDGVDDPMLKSATQPTPAARTSSANTPRV